MNLLLLKEKARIGIVNRGEAAHRFIRAVAEYNLLHKTSLSTVSFYTDSEPKALFVKKADMAFSLSEFEGFDQIKGSPYIDHDFILKALKIAKCDAVWVGWGFLAEDAQFARKVNQAQMVFIGPSSDSMKLLGDKIMAKELASKNNVPVLPWSEGTIDSKEQAYDWIKKIDLPVILKAANGGGGRGIRKINNLEEVDSKYQSVIDETFRFIGNKKVFMESMVSIGRHLEVQVAADYYQNVKTFGVRDCSVQRNNQKIIEETPPPFLDEKTIGQMEEASKRLILASKYVGVGTVEFIYDIAKKAPYFMEVNTRLQVEHPITEQVFGIDLVKTQISIAMGKELKNDSTPKGVAIEVRLNAEDPERDFTPSPGLVSLFTSPGGPGIRVDSGVEQGSIIPPEFDSMVAKIIAWAPKRDEAISRLILALQEINIKIDNGTTNRAFLRELLLTGPFQEGGVNTSFVSNILKEKKDFIKKDNWAVALMAVAIFQYEKRYEESFENFIRKFNRYSTPRNIFQETERKVTINFNDQKYNFYMKKVRDGFFHIKIFNKLIVVKYFATGEEIILSLNQNQKFKIQIVERGDFLQCEIDGVPYPLSIDSQGNVKAPSPSMVLSIAVKPGQLVKKGDLLLVLEAMKMEMAVSAPENGFISNICVRAGEQVSAGQLLLEMENTKVQQDKDQVNEIQKISFDSLSPDDNFQNNTKRFNILAREYLSVFSGHDFSSPVKYLLKDLHKLALEDPDLRNDFCNTMLLALKMFISIETLFSKTLVYEDGHARALTYQEYLRHYFFREEENGQGLPAKFLEALSAATQWHAVKGLSKEEISKHAIYRIYRSHVHLANKQQLILDTILILQQFNQDSFKGSLTILLDDFILLNQKENPYLADAASHMKYLLKSDKLRVKDVDDFYIQKDSLVLSILDVDQLAVEGKKLILKNIAEKFVSDRRILGGNFYEIYGQLFYYVNSNGLSDKYHLMVSIIHKNELIKGVDHYVQFLNEIKNAHLEVILFVIGDEDNFEDDLVKLILSKNISIKLLTLGIIHAPTKQIFYRSFGEQDGESWGEDVNRQYIDPIKFRKLNIGLLENFNLSLQERSLDLLLMLAQAKSNPRDQRFWAFLEMTTLDNELIFKTVQEMRLLQAKRHKQTHWNRIVIYVNTPLSSTYKAQMEKFIDENKYFRDINLEKIVIYNQISRDGPVKELEVLLDDERIKINEQNPSRETIKPLNSYENKIVRSKQLGVPYPYDLLRKLSPDKFEEFDIVNDNLLSVKGRPFGENCCNIVFGIISNKLSENSKIVRRVIILGDASSNFGALAEGECRRVMAAIDLAQEKDIPLEWIPLSSGAKIDMDSGTENLDWTAKVLKRIINFTQQGGEINIIISGVNVGAQSYWNAEATMLMHTCGLLIMTEKGSMLLTGKKALEYSGSVSAEDSISIGGAEKIMGPNGQSQVKAKDIFEAYNLLFKHYYFTYKEPGDLYPKQVETSDPSDRDVCNYPYNDFLNQGFKTVGDVLSVENNPERKKPFDVRQVMKSVIDQDSTYFERWPDMESAETGIVWETRIGGVAVSLMGIESRPLKRLGVIPNDGPETWTGGTLFPQSSKKVARGINAFSNRLPVVVLANLSGFDGSPESLRLNQLEFGAEIGRAVVNFKGPIIFVVIARYHGGAYVVFSKELNPNLKVLALEKTYASVIGGGAAAAVVFPRMVLNKTNKDQRITSALKKLHSDRTYTKQEYDKLYLEVYAQYQVEVAKMFDDIHSVERAKKVGSIDEIISPHLLRSRLIDLLTLTFDKKP